MDGRKREDGKQLVLVAGLCAGIFFLLFAIRGLWPLRKGSIQMIDLYTQYTPLLYRFYDVVTGSKNLFVDLSVSGGMNLYADTVNELINPFNYLLLPFGRGRLYLAVNLLPVFYGTAAAITSCAALQRLWPGKRKYNVILGLSYAFSGYMAYQFQIIRWLYLPVLFPLYVLALLRTLRKGRWGTYALLLGYQMALSLQMGVMALFFGLFGSGVWFLMEKRDGIRVRRSCLALGVGTFSGMLLSSPVLVPQIWLLLHSARAGENLSYFSVMKRHGLDDLFERLFQIYQPVLAGLLVYFGRRAVRRLHESGLPREGKALLGWNLLLCLTVLAQPSNLLWHLGSYMCFPVRYAYMVLFSGVLLVKWLAVWTEEKADEGSRIRPVWGIAALCLSAVAVAGSLFYQNGITQAFSSLAISMACPGEAVRVILFLTLLFAGSLLALRAGKARMLSLTCVAGGAGLCFFLFIMLPMDSQVRQLNEEAYARLNREYGENGSQEEKKGTFFRTQDDQDLPLNAALVRGGSSMSGYFPSGCEKTYVEGMEKLGYLTPWVSVRSWGGTQISDDLLGIAADDGAFPGGVWFSDTLEEMRISYEEACSEGPLAVQAGLGRMLTGEELVTRLSWGELPMDAEGYRLLDLPEKCALYLDAAREAGLLSVWVDDREMIFPEGELRESPHRLLDLGTYPAGSVRILVKERGGDPLSGSGMALGILSAGRWEESAQRILEGNGRAAALKEGQVILRKQEGEILIHLEARKEAGTLFLPVAACDGWHVYADGEERKPERLLGGFLGVMLSGGEEELIFRFIPPGWKVGLLLGMLGLVCLGINGILRIRCSGISVLLGGSRRQESPSGSPTHRGAQMEARLENKIYNSPDLNACKSGRMEEKGKTSEWTTVCGKMREKTQDLTFAIYRIILAAGLIGIYVIPNVGLLCYIGSKAFGRLFSFLK